MQIYFKAARLSFLCLAFFITAICVARADTLPTPEAARKLADEVMDKVSAGHIDAGMELTKKYTPLTSAEIDAIVQKMKDQIYPVVQKKYGSSLGHEFISQKTVGASLMEITYLQKYEKHPMPWIFVFYKTPKGWDLDTFYTFDQLQLLFMMPQ